MRYLYTFRIEPSSKTNESMIKLLLNLSTYIKIDFTEESFNKFRSELKQNNIELKKYNKNTLSHTRKNQMNWLMNKILCFIGLHRWDMPGGHCEHCGKCDEFFEKHNHYSREGIMVKEYTDYGWNVILPIDAKNYFKNKYIGLKKSGNYVINVITRSKAEEILEEWREHIRSN